MRMWHAASVRWRGTRTALGVFLGLALWLGLRAPLHAAPDSTSIRAYLEGRDDLKKGTRAAWVRAVSKAFGGAALKSESEQGANLEVRVAKEILAAAIFMEASPRDGAKAAFEGYRGALGYVPPPIAVQYQILALEGQPPKGRPIDLAFRFPEFYNDEIAPDLVAYWEAALEQGTIPDFALKETEEALEKTRLKMRPLLLDKLRLLARLARERVVAEGARRATIESDMSDLESELRRSFSRVARRPEVLDAARRPFDRLRIQAEDMGLELTAEDRFLDPTAPPPPRKAPPLEPEPPAPEPGSDGVSLVEPATPPPPLPPPPQPRPGDPKPVLEPMDQRALMDLLGAYRARLTRTVEPWLGTPYLWGGTVRGVGVDCSGFSREVYREGFDLGLPRVSRDQFMVGQSVTKEALQPGDLVFFDMKESGRVTHVGVYAGDGRFAHASFTRGVVYADLGAATYKRTFRGGRRVLAHPARAPGGR